MATPSRHVKNISSVHENDISHNMRIKYVVDEHGKKGCFSLSLRTVPYGGSPAMSPNTEQETPPTEIYLGSRVKSFRR